MIKTAQIPRLVTIVLAILMGMTLLLPAIANGQEDEDESSSRRGQPAEVAERVANRKAEAKTKVEEKRSEIEAKTQEQRKNVCEKKKSQAESAMNRVSQQATRLLGVMDGFYEKVQGFYENGQLTDPDYDTLNEAVLSAQDNATVEIAALSELNVDLDCDNPEVAASVNAFKNSAGDAKEALRNYRKALVGLISSLRAEAAEKESADDSSSESTETENENESESEDENETENENETEVETENEVEGQED